MILYSLNYLYNKNPWTSFGSAVEIQLACENIICNKIIEGMPEAGFTTGTVEQIKEIFSKQEAEIVSLNQSVKQKRQQLKNISDKATKLVQKKLIYGNPYQTQQLRPKFNPQFNDPQLKHLHSEREALHAQMSQIKQRVAMFKSEEEPQVVEEIRKKQSILQKLKREQEKIMQEKQFLKQKMEKNRELLEYFKNSPCLKQIEANKQKLEEIKKQMKALEKQSNEMLSEEVQINLFNFQMKSVIQRVQKQLDPDERPVEPAIIDQLVKEINHLSEERKIAERQYEAQTQSLERNIAFVARNNLEMERLLRQLTNDEMQRALDRKKRQIKNHKSSVFLPKQVTRRQAKPSLQKRQQTIQPWENTNQDETEQQPNDQILQIQRSFHDIRPNSSNKNVIIGKWNQQNCIKDDIIESGNISRAVSLKIRTKNKKIVGIGATYINKIGVQVIGRGNIWKNSNEQKEEDEEQFSIDLQEIQWLRYTKKQTNSIGLIWQCKNGQSISVGNVANSEQMQSILLNDHWVIKTAEFSLDQNFVNICGMKFRLVQYKADNPEQKVNKSSIGKWRSNSEVGLTKKKVFVKGSHSKKLSELSQVDHRLLLNRKKKMV